MCLTALTLAAFANTLANGFVWLDHWQVESGGLIVRSWAEFWTAIRQPLGAMPGWEGTAPYARPTVVSLLSLVHAIAGARPVAYHLALLLLHVANVLLAYGVLVALGCEWAVAFAAVAVFAVHPLQTAAVSWVSGIADPLFGCFTLLALRLQVAAAGGGRSAGAARVGALLSFILALGAKETAVVLPLLLGVTYVLFPASVDGGRRPGPVVPIRPILRAIAPFCVVVLGAGVYRLQVLGTAAFGRSVEIVPLTVRLWTLPRLLLSYVTLPVRWPSLTVCDDFGLSTGWSIETWCALAVVAALVAAVVYAWRHVPAVAYGTSWMLVGLLPVLNVVPILHYRADRFFYFPLIGWSLAVVSLVRTAGHWCVRRGFVSPERLSRGGVVVGAAGVLVLVGVTVHRNRSFADDVTLFESTGRVSPLCREAHTALGDAYLRAGRYADAVGEYDRARAAQPDRASYVVMPKVLINLGMAELGRHNYAAAAAAFTEAHRLQPHLVHPVFGLGLANLGLGDVAAAAEWLERANAMAPDVPDVLLNLALSYDRLGRPGEAGPLYRRYLDVAPPGPARGFAEQRLRAER